MFVSLGTPHAMRMYYIVNLINGNNFRKKNVLEHKMCILVPTNMLVGNFSHSKKKWAKYDQIYFFVSV